MIFDLLTEAQVIKMAVLLPLFGAALIAFAGERNRNIRETISLTTAVFEFILVASLTPEILEGARPSVDLFEMLPGLAITMPVEPLGQLFALIALAAALTLVQLSQGDNEGSCRNSGVFVNCV